MHVLVEAYRVQVVNWLAAVALWAADRGLLAWVQWPPEEVHYPGAAIPTTLVLAHCFARPGSAAYAAAFQHATSAKDADPIAVAVDAVVKAKRGQAHGQAAVAGDAGASIPTSEPGFLACVDHCMACTGRWFMRIAHQ